MGILKKSNNKENKEETSSKDTKSETPKVDSDAQKNADNIADKQIEMLNKIENENIFREKTGEITSTSLTSKIGNFTGTATKSIYLKSTETPSILNGQTSVQVTHVIDNLYKFNISSKVKTLSSPSKSGLTVTSFISGT